MIASFSQRRSKDGFVSATGMFKIAFPWAKSEEEQRERAYLKTCEHTSEEEVAGNMWVSPTFGMFSLLSLIHHLLTSVCLSFGALQRIQDVSLGARVAGPQRHCTKFQTQQLYYTPSHI